MCVCVYVCADRMRKKQEQLIQEFQNVKHSFGGDIFLNTIKIGLYDFSICLRVLLGSTSTWLYGFYFDVRMCACMFTCTCTCVCMCVRVRI